MRRMIAFVVALALVTVACSTSIQDTPVEEPEENQTIIVQEDDVTEEDSPDVTDVTEEDSPDVTDVTEEDSPDIVDVVEEDPPDVTDVAEEESPDVVDVAEEDLVEVIVEDDPVVTTTPKENPCPFNTELPEGIQLILDGELEDFQIRGVCAGIIDTKELFNSYGVDMPSAKIYLFADNQRAINKLGALTNRTFARRTWTNNTAGYTIGRNIIISMSSISWEAFRYITIHELIHVLQKNLNDAKWLSEGSADYMRSLAAEMRGEWDMDKRRKSLGEYIYLHLEDGDANLRSLESPSNFRKAKKGYSIAYIAFGLLVSESENGVKDYLSCYLPERRSTSWRNAFEKCFDMSVSEFYDVFEEYKDLGFSELPIERRERERDEFQLLVDQCRVNAIWSGTRQLRAMC